MTTYAYFVNTTAEMLIGDQVDAQNMRDREEWIALLDNEWNTKTSAVKDVKENFAGAEECNVLMESYAVY